MSTTRRFGLLQGTIVLAAVTTALIHIVLAFQFPGGVDSVFLLNGVGYLVLTALLFLPLAALDPYRNLFRWILIVYTLVTVLAWLFIGVRSPIAYADKAIEILLILCLWLDWQQTRGRRV
jgi:cellulose synthase/poly-beta-1,6-N-acetylglucosamine synthase-like glycosyltransferase